MVAGVSFYSAHFVSVHSHGTSLVDVERAFLGTMVISVDRIVVGPWSTRLTRCTSGDASHRGASMLRGLLGEDSSRRERIVRAVSFGVARHERSRARVRARHGRGVPFFASSSNRLLRRTLRDPECRVPIIGADDEWSSGSYGARMRCVPVSRRVSEESTERDERAGSLVIDVIAVAYENPT